MDTDSLAYFARRAALEQQQARAAPTPAIAAIHAQMATEYRRRIDAAAAFDAP